MSTDPTPTPVSRTNLATLWLILCLGFIGLGVAYFWRGEQKVNAFCAECTSKTEAAVRGEKANHRFVVHNAQIRSGLSSWSGPCGGQWVPIGEEPE